MRRSAGRRRRRWAAVWICLAGWVAARASESPAPSASGGDPPRVFLEERVRSDPDDNVAWNRLGGLYLERLRREGDLGFATLAARAAAESLRAVPAGENRNGVVLHALAAQAAHGFAAARADGELLSSAEPERAEGWRIQGDACFELGDYAAAEEAWARLARLEPGASGTELRRARLAFIRGRSGEAARLFGVARAAAEKEAPRAPDTVAWCLVQRGYLAFLNGELEVAEKAYRLALAETPGWFVAEDHLGEVLAAKGDYEGALARYRPLAERLRRPELWQALGDVLVAAGRVAEAEGWHDRAGAEFLAQAEAGNAHYYHHLAGFYADVRVNPAEAVRWARRDLTLRRSVGAWDALAWALHRAGADVEAQAAMRNALAPGVRDPHLLVHAALVFHAVGETARGREYLLEAKALNPLYNGFHVHR
jgi:tetratricopeptide (TPR) repeat protein